MIVMTHEYATTVNEQKKDDEPVREPRMDRTRNIPDHCS